MRWIHKPLFQIISNHFLFYPTPINLNYMWGWGSIAGICLIIQIITGIFLSMHYVPNVELAFDSVEHIMRNVNKGWLFRYTHANGASMFFVAIYMHMARGLYYKSYRQPRHYLWWSGILLFVLLMATAFIGYVLPWGQMSYWGATVITNLFTAIPYVGKDLAQFIWGGYSVGDATLNRFFVFHFLLPFIMVAVTILHLALLHEVGSSNPLGIIQEECINLYPFFIVKDIFGFLIFASVWGYFVFFDPNYLGHPDNYIRANPLSTPAHIVPEWYFLPFYAILRTIPHKLGGVLCMGLSIAILIFLPYLDKTPVASTRFSQYSRQLFWFFAVDVLWLGFLGGNPIEEPFICLSWIATFSYFIYFILLFLLTSLEKNISDSIVN